MRSRVPATPERRSSRGTGAHRRERGEQRVEQRVADPVPAGHHPQPGVAVARRGAGPGPMRCRSPSGGARRTGRREGVGHHVGRMAPGEAVTLEVEVADDGAGRRQRVEGAEQVGDEARRHALGAAHGATDLVLGLDEHDVPAGVGQAVRGHQAVGPAPTTTASQVVEDTGLLAWAARPGRSPPLPTHPGRSTPRHPGLPSRPAG